MLYLEDFYVGDVLGGGYSGTKFMKFVCKKTDEDIPIFVNVIIRDEKRAQFKWWWNGSWNSIPENKIFDTGVSKDFHHTKTFESFYGFNFSSNAFGGYSSYSSKETSPDKNGVYGIIPKGSFYWKCGECYISDRLVLDFNEQKLMTLEEAIKHCEEKACDKSNCALEHKQLAEWLTELKKFKEEPKIKGWHKFSEELPPHGVPVLAYHHLWVDEDFNPQGIREGFLEDNCASDSKECPYDFCSAHWWDYQDCYMTISKLEIEGHENEYSDNIRNSIIPEYWIEIPTPPMKLN